MSANYLKIQWQKIQTEILKISSKINCGNCNYKNMMVNV